MKNNRTFLEKLLDGTEVEWKPLGDVCNFQNGFTFKSSLFKDNGSPIVRITNIDGGRVNLSDVKYFLMDDYNTDMAAYEVHKDDILIAMSGATTGKIGFYNYEHTSYLNQRVGKFLPNTNILNNRYLYHYLLSKVEDIYIISGGGAQPNLSSNRLMSEVLIPIPPLSVQTEIVKILDALTALTSELTSELILRRKQYEYYREKLLSEEELIKLGATTENLGDITSITSGGTPSTKEPAYWVEGNIPWIKSESCKNKLIDEIKHHITEMGLQNSNAKLLSPNTTLMAMVGATIFKTAFLPFEATTNQNIAAIKSKNELSITDKFIFYYLTNMYDFFISKLSGYNMVNLSQIKNIKILLPPLEEQQRIVSILDKFETLTNSITEGLPLAIEQSQKRYEYYRELLLNFS
nr:restriction endonuclease subunit S [uncultured Aggregatibacter sp.]